MKYRKFGNTGFEASALGFGAMRLPLIKEGAGEKDIDEKKAAEMIRYAVDAGINYFDTAYVYHGGESETFLGKALKGGYREKVKIADKIIPDMVDEEDGLEKILDEELKKLQINHLDFFLFHALNKSRWDKMLKLGLIERAEKLKKKGKIGHIGFSFHDNFESFKNITDGYKGWEFCQIQMNYMDVNNQAELKGMKYAGKKNIPVVIMEPLLGGRLANPPKEVEKIFKKSGIYETPAEWSLQWLWNRPEVAVVLSGMSTMGQLRENIKYAGRSAIGSFGDKESRVIEKASEEFEKRAVIPCTACNYCMPCPGGVNIPKNFEFYNEGVIYDDFSAPRFIYNRFFKESERAYNCVQCDECLEKCPQNIKIGEWMKQVDGKLREK